MTKRRMISLALALCILLPASALADTRSPMRLMDIGGESAYWMAHPAIKKEAFIYDWRIDALTHIQGENPPDVMTLRTSSDGFAAIRDAGVLSDLSDSDVILDAVSRMQPEARQLVTAEDGRILGLPVLHMVNPLYWYQDAWDKAGLTEADVPQSYTELLDFLQRWSESPSKDVCVTRMLRWNGGKEMYHYANWLIRTLTLDWLMQRQYVSEVVCFGKPEFIALAQRAREIGLKLYEIEPSEKERAKLPQLFQNNMMGGEHANDGREDGLSHTIPNRITADQPMLMMAVMDIACIRNGSEWYEEALDFLTFYKDERPLFGQYTLYTDFQSGAYSDKSSSFVIADGWMEDYRAYKGTLFYPRISLMNSAVYEEMLDKFIKGQITAEELARGIDTIE